MDDMRRKFEEVCRELGWKFTRRRYAVYRLMAGNTEHPTADAVREKLLADYPSINRDSVFRILNDFAQAGLITRMEFTDPVRFDGNVRRHDHFFCRRCGKVADFDAWVPSDGFPAEAGEIHSVEVRAVGLCRNCAKETGNSK